MPLIKIIDSDLRNRSLYAERQGNGAPTIIIEVGGMMAGTQDTAWRPIREALAQKTSVLSYDRANLGQSDPAPKPRTLDEFAHDLREVLMVTRVPTPYLLVGGSLGGMIVTHYASLFPEHVCGILLIDPPHPEVNLRTIEILPKETPDEPRSLADFRQIAWQEQFFPLDGKESEGFDYQSSLSQAWATWNLHDIPLVVLTAGMNTWEDDFPPEVAQAYEKIWMDLQKEYTSLSNRSTHSVIEGSDHEIHDRHPEVVLETILQLMDTCKR